MKFRVLLLGLAMTTGGLLAQTPPASTTPAEPVKPPASTKPAAPKPAAPTSKPAVKKEETMGHVDGLVIARANGTFLGLTLDAERKFKLTFYDKKKKPTKPDVDRVLARWPNVHGPGDNRTVLNPADATSMLGAMPVRGPYAFLLFLTLLRGEGDAAQAVETYTVQFSQ